MKRLYLAACLTLLAVNAMAANGPPPATVSPPKTPPLWSKIDDANCSVLLNAVVYLADRSSTATMLGQGVGAVIKQYCQDPNNAPAGPTLVPQGTPESPTPSAQ